MEELGISIDKCKYFQQEHEVVFCYYDVRKLYLEL